MSDSGSETVGWAPPACALPIAGQPDRLAEFDGLLAAAVRGVERVDAGRVLLELDPDPQVAARAGDLMVREAQCCSFFTFTLRAGGGRVVLEIAVPEGQVGVLEGLVALAAAGLR